MHACPVCLTHAEQWQITVAKDRMLDIPGEFEYYECPSCRSLHLKDIPDLALFYPQTYYSLQAPKMSFTEKLQQWLVDNQQVAHFVSICRRGSRSLKKSDRILDVGSGKGTLLRALRRKGFDQLYGVDPYLESSVSDDGITLVKGSLEDLADNSFDVILFNHSLEHIVEMEQTLSTAARKLRKDGILVVRIPMPGNAWRRYGSCWFALDAPRHIYLMSEIGMYAVANRAGFTPTSVLFDSTPNNFWVSESYLRGKTLEEARPKTLLTMFFHVLGRARWLPSLYLSNRTHTGDQASFTFARSEELVDASRGDAVLA